MSVCKLSLSKEVAMEVHNTGGNPINFFAGKESSPAGSAQKMNGKLQNVYATAMKGRVLSEGVKESESSLQTLNVSSAKERALFKKIDRFAQGHLS